MVRKIFAFIRVIRGQPQHSREPKSMKSAVKPPFTPLADHAHGIVRVERLEVRARDAEIHDAFVGVKLLVEQARGVLDELEIRAVQLAKACSSSRFTITCVSV